MEEGQIIFAGLDRDGIAKLWFMDRASGVMCPLTHTDWLKVLEFRKARPGEMLVAPLMRQPWKTAHHIQIESSEFFRMRMTDRVLLSSIQVTCACRQVMRLPIRRLGDIEDKDRIGDGEHFSVRDPNTPIIQDTDCPSCRIHWEAHMYASGDCVLSPRKPEGL